MEVSFFGVFRAIFGRNELEPGDCLATNALVGVLSLFGGVLMVLREVPHSSLPGGVLFLAAGAFLLVGAPIVHRRPGLADAFLFAQGVLVLALGFYALGSMIVTFRRSLAGEKAYNVRYLPGLGVWMLTYGALQVVNFGGWAKRPRWPVQAVAAAGAVLEMYLLSLIVRDAL